MMMLGTILEKKYGTLDVMDVLKRYVDKGYFIQFSNIEKLGINPQSGFDTPLGIYSYPLTADIYNQIRSKEIPYGSDRKYIVLFRPSIYLNIYEVDKKGNTKHFTEKDLNDYLKPLRSNLVRHEDKDAQHGDIESYIRSLLVFAGAYVYGLQSWLHDSIFEVLNDKSFSAADPKASIFMFKKKLYQFAHGYATAMHLDIMDFSAMIENLFRDKRAIYTLLKIFRLKNELNKAEAQDSSDLTNLEQVDSAETNARFKTPFGKFWNITRIVSGNMKSWRTTLVKLGIDGVVDHGSGLIHENEPTQAVFFSANGLKLIHILHNPLDASAKDPPSEQQIQFLKIKKAARKMRQIYAARMDGKLSPATLRKYFKKINSNEKIRSIVKIMKVYDELSKVEYSIDPDKMVDAFRRVHREISKQNFPLLITNDQYFNVFESKLDVHLQWLKSSHVLTFHSQEEAQQEIQDLEKFFKQLKIRRSLFKRFLRLASKNDIKFSLTYDRTYVQNVIVDSEILDMYEKIQKMVDEDYRQMVERDIKKNRRSALPSMKLSKFIDGQY